MPRLSLWNPVKTNDFNFIDRIVGEHLYAGGTGVHLHKYLGVPDDSQPDGVSDELFIQDLVFLENRDRRYDDSIYELRGSYNIPDSDAFDLTQFAMFLSDDTIMMTFHIESMVETVGRKIMAGDVLELPHLRDDILLGREGAINRFYVVTDAARPAEGYDPNWWPHLWRVKGKLITDSQEYRDIIGDGSQEDDLRDLVSRYDQDIKISDAIIAEAAGEVKHDPQYRDTFHLYYDPEVPHKPVIEFDDYADGAAPVNGFNLVGSGTSFPPDANDDDYFLRTDFVPNRLFQKSGSRWVKIGDDNKFVWNAANRVLTTFINNDAERTNTDGSTEPEKTNLSKVVKPRTDN